MTKGHLIGAAIPRIGMLLAGDRSYPSFTAFCDGLAALAHIEGQTFEMEARFAAGQLDQLSSLAEELVALRVDIIAVIGAVTLQAVRRVTSHIPIVFTVVLDPVVAGLVRDAERPGGNATGVTNFDPEQARTQISIVKQTFPNLSRLAIMGDAGVPNTLPNLYTAEAEAAGLRPQMVLLRGQRTSRRPSRRSGATAQRPCCLWRCHAPALMASRLPNAQCLPGCQRCSHGIWPTTGRCLSLKGVAADGRNVDRILKGAKPGDMPIERVMQPELIVSLRGAERIGIPIPPEVLAAADRVIA
ncbi:ABC transporter substrate-binding protein [Rhizobium binae]|uniref:ABC transporter substrate-binding protein n=1 Tax=Rhizobium binae TaxID=1138190 RepID=UPI001C8321B0|nr:ABC transporter substrate-binding protein [Rhizobium binae]MBX4928459.1 ABC transporter substrate-binding protein [Rhizobium binae]